MIKHKRPPGMDRGPLVYVFNVGSGVTYFTWNRKLVSVCSFWPARSTGEGKP